ncbi:MAG TPA: arginine--tRNA ligase [Solirubrobacterales bacterium]|nr:arginine--tRNA ligase [Solirubrobacterales bacterium]
MEPARNPTGDLGEAIAAATAELHPGVPAAALERPPRPEFGDYSTNAAMLAAPLIGEPPRDVAARLADGLRERLGDSVERSEIAGPGFVNLHMSEPWMRDAAALIAARGRSFGAGVAERPRRVLVEFVSANPTGPLTVASGRHLAYGDSLARILEFAGHRVEREYYLNDAGSQIDLFGASIAARIAGTEVPEGGYEGDYVAELGTRIAAERGSGLEAAELGRLGVELMLAGIRRTLERSRVSFDSWASERSLHEAGATEAAITELRGRDLVYESEGAVWLRTSRFGDDKDRVLIRADGAPTYFAADIGYHRDKLERGYELLFDVLGADHHGYVGRVRAAIAAFGAEPDTFEVAIMQMVNLVEGGERARMSKRRGDFARLDDLLDDIGVDATRFFMLMRSHETPIDIDLDLARAHSSDNPVYYAQYAHARICSIFRTAAERGTETGDDPAPEGTLEPAERALIARLLEAPEQIRRAAAKREPHGLTSYVREIAADFHAFYRDCRVVGAGPGLEQARLTVCAATRDVIATVLGLLGVEAPEEM